MSAGTFTPNPTIFNVSQPLPERFIGARFRPCRWSDIHDRTVPDTWGLEAKPKGQRYYKPVGWDMQVNPFKTEAEAKAVCKELNLSASEGRA